MMPEPEENRLDQSLRGKFEEFDLPPGAPVWAGIEARLGPPPRLRPRRRPWLVPLLLVLTAFVAGLGGWLLPHGPENRNSATAYQRPKTTGLASISTKAGLALPKRTPDLLKESPISAKSRSVLPNSGSPLPESGLILPESGSILPESGLTLPNSGLTLPSLKSISTQLGSISPKLNSISPNLNLLVASRVPQPTPEGAGQAAAVATAAGAAETLPATLRPLAALERQTLVQLPSVGTLAPGTLPADGRAALLTTLRAERAELFRLQRRADSLLLALGDLPAAPRPARADTTQQPDTKGLLPKTSKWSLLLTATPEQNTLALQGAEGDSLTALRRNHETGRAGFSAGLLAEYRLTPRLSVGGGVGYTALGADLRITNKTTEVRVRYDSVRTTTIGVFSSTHQTYSIRIVQTPQLSPVFNGNGQVIRYDTVYVPRQDTVFTTTVQHDTVRTHRTTVTPTISKKETLTSKLLQPNYRFFTVPVLLRYHLATPGLSRLWTDVAVGAQLQFFLGGTQVLTDDGEHFRTERITVASSPFRALNVALSGSLALNYALTPRLSVSVAPSMRWQALSLYKPETGLRQQATSTGLMFGVRFGL